jgi:hypothetical protein
LAGGYAHRVRVLYAPRWLLRHAIVLVVVAAFLALAWWQFGRAAGGNLLSYAYAVEWPVFAGFVIFVWVKEMQRALGTPDAAEPSADAAATDADSKAPGTVDPKTTRRAGPAYDDGDDPELAAYNRYLAWLGANPQKSRADYPG